jgi:hypothetical protein
MYKELFVEFYCQETRIIKMEIHIYSMTERDVKKRKYIWELAQKERNLILESTHEKREGNVRGFKRLQQKFISFDCDFISLPTKLYLAVIIKYCENLKIH